MAVPEESLEIMLWSKISDEIILSSSFLWMRKSTKWSLQLRIDQEQKYPRDIAPVIPRTYLISFS